MSGGHASSGTAARYSAAAVHLLFQTRPGTAADRRITTGGTATVTLRSGAVSQVDPVDGIYHFDLPDGDEAAFELFGTQYHVVRVDGMARDPGGSTTIVVWSGALRPITDPDGLLQRLQILGYNTDPVDMNMSAGAERGVLEFQADNGLVIDGDPGSRTRTKVDEVFGHAGHMRGTTQPLTRRYLAFFERAAYGVTRRDSPQIDFRGGGKGRLTLPAPGANPTPSTGTDSAFYRLGCTRKSIDESAFPWYVSLQSGNGSIILRTPILASSSDRLEVSTNAVGNAVLEVRQGSEQGPVIAELDIQVVPVKTVTLFGHILRVQQSGTGTELTDPPIWTREEAQSLIDGINDVWNPVGIRFVFHGFEEHIVSEPEAGWITDDYILYRIQSDAIANRFNRRDAINVYFTQRLRQIYLNADGQREDSEPLAFAGDKWIYHPSMVFTGKMDTLPRLARVLAHEFGHMLRLTAAPYAHSDDRGVAMPWRHDIWSRMRLMAKYTGYFKNEPDRDWQDTTYGIDGDGAMNSGDLITIKNLPNDETDGEAERSRTFARNPYPHSGRALNA